jgi:ATP-binding cassette subfamily B protein
MTKLLKYLKPMTGTLIVTMFLIAFQAYFALLIPDIMSNITTIMQNPDTYAETMPGLITLFSYHLIPPTGNRMTDTWIIGGIMIAFAFGFLLCALLSSISVSKMSAYLGKTIRKETFSHVLHLSVSQYGEVGTASLITRTTNDIEQVTNAFGMGLRIIIMAPVSLIIAIIMVVSRDWKLALIVAASIPIIVITAVLLLHYANPLFTKIQESFDHLTMVLRESLTGVRVIRAFDREKKEKERYEKANSEQRDISIKVSRAMSIANPIISIAFDVTYIAIYFYGFASVDGATYIFDPVTQTVSGGFVDFSVIIASAQYAMQIMQSFMMFAMLLIFLPRAEASARRINEVLEKTPVIKDPASPKVTDDHSGVVAFNDVSFAFPGADAPTLEHISFKTKPGKTTAIIGSTGSGKSSIINLIPRFYDVTSGSVSVDGEDVRDYSQKELRSRLGFVPQQALLFTGTIKDNVSFGKKDASDEEVNKALEVAQATHFVSKKEKGIYSEVEQGGKNFSGGQKQRLAIARALVRKPEIYVFDDSFSALDFKTDIKLRMALKDYAKDSSVIVVAQRVSTIIDADDIVVLDNGKMVGEGTHQELLASCPVYQEIVYSQLDKDEIKKTLALAKQTMAEGRE